MLDHDLEFPCELGHFVGSLGAVPGADLSRAKSPGRYKGNHATPFWIIDAEGKLRASLHADDRLLGIVAEVGALLR